MRRSCARCLRPAEFCVCDGLVPAPSRTRVVLLQHPREARLAICSAWLTRLALENAELHRGVSFEGRSRVRELARATRRGAPLPRPRLDPGAASSPATPRRCSSRWTGPGTRPRRCCACPRPSPPCPGCRWTPAARAATAGCGAEPGAVHLSTLEAVALALGDLEGAPERFAPMVAAFHRSVALQLACARGERRSPRHRGDGRDGDDA